MKRRVRIIALLIVSITSFSFLSSCFFYSKKSEEEIARSLIEGNSKIELPENAEIVYHIRQKDEHHYQDADYQYTVFQFESVPVEWLRDNRFADSSNEVKRKEFENSFTSDLNAKPDSMESIPSEYLPNYDEPYYYQLTNDVYFMFSPHNLLLIAIVS